ncbi:MAG: prepilin-type N-terminal cleavage/methylation domain-containing protein [Myxococcales bacterium]|jgi:general secretion pathway protein H|nr:prepilin-type N-terminal cleavage/methylation domain-containing protein [Myxococcales bacterium]
MKPSATERAVRRNRPRGARRSDSGLTLIEISIALLIVALLMFVAVPSIEAIAGIRAREEAGKLAGAIRYLYGHAALMGKTCRLRFDLDEQTYAAQCTEERFTVSGVKERSRDGLKLEEKEERWSSRTVSSVHDELIGSAEALREKIEKQASFSDFTDQELKPRTLPDGANLAVWTTRQTERYTQGEAFLYFFPQGYTERAQLYVSDDAGDDVYTLVVAPLSGKVRVEFGDRKEPDR